MRLRARIVLNFLALSAFLPTGIAHAAPSLLAFPESPLQGQAVLVTVAGDSSTTSLKVQSATFDGKPLNFFVLGTTTEALIGIDLKKKAGEYSVRVILDDAAHTLLQRNISVVSRTIEKAPLGIPESLGGNATSSQKKLIGTLAADNAVLSGIRTNKKVLWKEPFAAPLESVFVTDPFGVMRQVGAYLISHNGVDLRAASGTSVKATNRGVVRIARTLQTYGKTVVIDHGNGVFSLYVHLSKIFVSPGQLVGRLEEIGLSGGTGYAEGVHLHWGLRIGGVPVDPLQFLAVSQRH